MKNLKQLLWISVLSIFYVFANAQYVNNDPTFNTLDNGPNNRFVGFNGGIYSSLIQSDGKIIVAGGFTSIDNVPRNRIARLNVDGSLDFSFNIGNGFNGNVLSIAIQSDGKVIVVGNFTMLNYTRRESIARLNVDGSLDTSFNIESGFDLSARTLTIQSDGKILVGGHFNFFKGIPRKGICRINLDGSLDTTFNPGTGFSNSVTSLSIQADGKVIVGGSYTSFNGMPQNNLARLNLDGSLDTSFNWGIGFDNYVSSTVVQGDGKIIVVGDFTSYNNESKNRIVRLNIDGSIDNTFNVGSGFNDEVFTCAIQFDGKILLGGAFTEYKGTNMNKIARLNLDGSADSFFNQGAGFFGGFSNFNGRVFSCTIQFDGKILIGGAFDFFNVYNSKNLVRLNNNGSIHTSFYQGAGFDLPVLTTAIQSDGKIVVGGEFMTFNGVIRKFIARLNIDGSLDTTFDVGTGFNFKVLSLAIQSDGKIVVGGEFNKFNGSTTNRIARLNTDGSIDTTFNLGIGFSHFVRTISIQNDSKIIVGGDFITYNGENRNRIARLNTDGSLDFTFNVGSGFNLSVYNTAIQSDGKIIVGGTFTDFDGISKIRLARLNQNGSLDSPFNPDTGFNGMVRSVAIQSDGKIVVGGSFTSFHGTDRNRIARLNADGSLNASFHQGIGFNSTVYHIAIQADDKIVVNGLFNNFNGVSGQYLARLKSDCTLDSSFNLGMAFNGPVYSTAIQSDGKIVVGGNFNQFNGIWRNRIARLVDCPPNKDVISACDSFTWIDGITYTSSNYSATHPIPNIPGCDSVLTLNLTINNPPNNSVSINGETLSADENDAAYQWLDCKNGNTAIAGEINQSFTPTVNRTYAVEITQNTCVAISDCINITNVGTDAFMNEHIINVFPNPTNGEVIITVPIAMIGQSITITNMFGQQINRMVIDQTSFSIDLSNNANGVYFFAKHY